MDADYAMTATAAHYNVKFVKLPCLKCGRQFRSVDSTRNRLCPRCNNHNLKSDIKYSEKFVHDPPESLRKKLTI